MPKNKKMHFFFVSMMTCSILSLWGCQSSSKPSKVQYSTAERPLQVIRSRDGIQNIRLKIIEINGQKAKFFQQEPYLELRASHKLLSGHTGCNPVFGKYTLNTQLLKIDFDARTGHQRCDGALPQEAELIQILNEIQAYKMLGNRIQFLNARGQILLTTQK